MPLFSAFSASAVSHTWCYSTILIWHIFYWFSDIAFAWMIAYFTASPQHADTNIMLDILLLLLFCRTAATAGRTFHANTAQRQRVSASAWSRRFLMLFYTIRSCCLILWEMLLLFFYFLTMRFAESIRCRHLPSTAFARRQMRDEISLFTRITYRQPIFDSFRYSLSTLLIIYQH